MPHHGETQPPNGSADKAAPQGPPPLRGELKIEMAGEHVQALLHLIRLYGADVVVTVSLKFHGDLVANTVRAQAQLEMQRVMAAAQIARGGN